MKKMVCIIVSVLVAAAVALTAFFAWLYLHGLSGMTSYSSPSDGQIRVACVGDSITYGHGIRNWPENQYPAVLSDLLGDGYHVQNFGVSGRAVQNDSDQPYTATDQYRESLEYDADILVFMMGTNDSKPENWHDVTQFKEALHRLLDSYVTPGHEPVIFLCTSTTAYFTEDAAGELAGFDIQPAVVDEIALAAAEVAVERGCHLIDIHALTADHPEWFSKDGIHPDNDGADAIARAVCDAITEYYQ